MDRITLANEILKLVGRYYQEKFRHTAFRPRQKDLVHYAGRVFDENELVNLVDASLDFFLTANRYADQFESRLRRISSAYPMRFWSIPVRRPIWWR